MAVASLAQAPKDSLRDESERIEAAAWCDVFASASPAQARALGLRVERRGGVVALLAPGIDHVLVNRAIGLGTGEPSTGAAVRALVERYVDAGVPRFFVHLADDARQAQLPSWLADAGLTRYRRDWIKLGGSLRSTMRASTSLEIARLTRRHVEGASAILEQGFDLPRVGAALLAGLVERPRWHVFGGFDAGHLVGAAALFVDAQTAYLAFTATAPDHRRRGAQAALIERRLATALALGCTRVVSETGDDAPGDPQHSYKNLTRAGLAPLCRRANWTLPGTRW